MEVVEDFLGSNNFPDFLQALNACETAAGQENPAKFFNKSRKRGVDFLNVFVYVQYGLAAVKDEYRRTAALEIVILWTRILSVFRSRVLTDSMLLQVEKDIATFDIALDKFRHFESSDGKKVFCHNRHIISGQCSQTPLLQPYFKRLSTPKLHHLNHLAHQGRDAGPFGETSTEHGETNIKVAKAFVNATNKNADTYMGSVATLLTTNCVFDRVYQPIFLRSRSFEAARISIQYNNKAGVIRGFLDHRVSGGITFGPLDRAYHLPFRTAPVPFRVSPDVATAVNPHLRHLPDIFLRDQGVSLVEKVIFTFGEIYCSSPPLFLSLLGPEFRHPLVEEQLRRPFIVRATTSSYLGKSRFSFILFRRGSSPSPGIGRVLTMFKTEPISSESGRGPRFLFVRLFQRESEFPEGIRCCRCTTCQLFRRSGTAVLLRPAETEFLTGFVVIRAEDILSLAQVPLFLVVPASFFFGQGLRSAPALQYVFDERPLPEAGILGQLRSSLSAWFSAVPHPGDQERTLSQGTFDSRYRPFSWIISSPAALICSGENETKSLGRSSTAGHDPKREKKPKGKNVTSSDSGIVQQQTEAEEHGAPGPGGGRGSD